MSNIYYLQEPAQIAHYIRVGYGEHILADRMRAEGRVTQTGIVFNSSSVEAQRSTLADFRSEGHQLILDTNVAEQSVIGLYSKSYSEAPWASKDAALSEKDFRAGGNRYVIEPIARFSVERGFHSVLSPAHYLGGSEVKWFKVDLESCEKFRELLDREGGRAIDVIYPLILDNSQIKNPRVVSQIASALADMPISAIWLRVAGFGRDATGAGIDKMARAVLALHRLNIPIVMDKLGGLPAYALASFGVTSGYVNGMKGRDTFRTADWFKSTSTGGGGGNERKVFVSGLDRRMNVSDMRRLFDASSTARLVYGCPNPACCASVDVMLREPEAHHLGEQARTVAELSAVPERKRANYFLNTYLEEKRRKAGRSLRLKKVDEEFRKIGEKSAIRLNRMKDALEQTERRLGTISFAPEVLMPASMNEEAPIARGTR